MRHLSPFDKFIQNAVLALRTLVPGAAHEQRPSPAQTSDEGELDEQERKHAAGLMRINHTGEVCAQALYQGQALTAKLPEVREAIKYLVDYEGMQNSFLNGQYTVYGQVTSGMEHVDAITRGEPPVNPDRMISVKVAADV